MRALPVLGQTGPGHRRKHQAIDGMTNECEMEVRMLERPNQRLSQDEVE